MNPEMASKINVDAIPDDVRNILKGFKSGGFEAYLVGGCVRDLIMGIEPKDWDITTNAIPEQIIGLFPKTFYENSFGTVGVVDEGTGRVVEATPYRTEGAYSDKRRPDTVLFSQNLEDDLMRRDFTMNALAFDPEMLTLVDMYGGVADIASKTIRAVGDAKKRFTEDGLRLLRAVRFSAQLGFMINTDTEKALIDSCETLEFIAKERIRDEFSKILSTNAPMIGIVLCQRYGLLKNMVPELEEGLHTKQNQAHSYDVFEHLVRSLQCAADKDYSLEIRIAALFHDIGKPKSRRFSKEKGDYTFYGHEVIGAEMTKTIMERLNYPRKTIDLVYKLVRWHMFFSDTEQITLSAVRRMIANVGQDHIWDLMNLRICDRVGTGRPKENPYRLRKYTAMIEEVLRDPVSVGMLKIDGNTLISKLGIAPGKKIGLILNALLEEVIENPALNAPEYLLKRSSELQNADESLLVKLADQGKKAQESKEKEAADEIKRKYKV